MEKTTKKKNFLFEMQESNSRIIFAILQDPAVNDGVVTGTKVGVFAGFDDESPEEKMIFRRCEPTQFYASGGPWAMEEYKGTLE